MANNESHKSETLPRQLTRATEALGWVDGTSSSDAATNELTPLQSTEARGQGNKGTKQEQSKSQPSKQS